jgi:hypothetical protein
MARRAFIRATGLKAAIRDLRAVNAQAADEVLDVLHGRAQRAARLAAAAAPRGTRRRRRGRGRPGLPLHQSIRAVRTPAGGAVVSRKPYANIQEEGGTTPSRYSSSTRPKAYIEGKHFVRDVLETEDPLIAQQLEREIAQLFAAHNLPLTRH